MSAPAGTPQPSHLRQAKQALRRTILSARDALPIEQRALLSERITARLLELAAFQTARSVLAYLSFGGEFQTAAFVDTLRSRGVEIALPRVNRTARRLDIFRILDPQADTIAGPWGIREPDPARCSLARLDEIDAILVPGVAFTTICERLGYGGGFYDRLLQHWPRQSHFIAAAFDVQMVDSLPISADDRPVDAVITESRFYPKDTGGG